MELLPKKTFQISEKESLVKTHEENHDEVCAVHVDAPLCSPHGYEGLVSLFPFHSFETEPSKGDHCEHGYASTSNEDRGIQRYVTIDKQSHIFYNDLDDNHWTYLENPFLIYLKEVLILAPLDNLVWKRFQIVPMIISNHIQVQMIHI